jgi:photosystem II stability/assembly factor-like uncharacterized protein
MRTLVFTFLMFSIVELQAQWNKISTTITEDLTDVHFATNLLGITTGASGGVYLTTNGGFHWQALESPTKDPLSTCYLLNRDTMFVAGDYLYRTTDGGLNWTLYEDHFLVRDLHFTSQNNGIMIDIDKTWITTDAGKTWTESFNQGNTLVLWQVYETDDNKPVVFGNIDGIITYSAFGHKKADDGNWYAFDYFSFPNSNAFATAFYTDTNHCMMFANKNEHWAAGSINQLWKLSNFKLEPDPFTAEPTWYFTSEIINPLLPEYINSSFFTDTLNGYAAGDSGRIYQTINGGVSWNVVFNGTSPVKSMVFRSNTHAVAVGNAGLVVVLGDEGSGIVTQSEPLSVITLQPNPAKETTTIKTENQFQWIEVYNLTGRLIARYQTLQQSSFQLPIKNLSSGLYLIKAGGLGWTSPTQLLKVTK